MCVFVFLQVPNNGQLFSRIRNTIQTLARRIELQDEPQWDTRVIWNGMVGTQFCGATTNGLQARQFGEGASCPLPGAGGDRC